MAMRKTFKKHKYSPTIEILSKNLYRANAEEEAKALHWLLKNLSDEGVTEEDFLEGYNAFKETRYFSYGVRYFKAFLLGRVQQRQQAKEEFSDIW